MFKWLNKASIFFRRCTLLKILPKIGTGLILLAPTVFKREIRKLDLEALMASDDCS
jgi:hypothetical protein